MTDKMTVAPDATATPIDLTQKNLPDLTKANVSVMDYGSEYWTPESEGEHIRAYYLGSSDKMVQDTFGDGPDKLIPCVNLLIQDGEGLRTIYNGSKRLVAAFRDNNLQIGTPVEITYRGKRKNKTNSYSSDRWSIRPIILNID